MAEIIDLDEARRLKRAGRSPTSDRDEDLTSVGAEVLREMALLLLGQPPDRDLKRAVTPPPDEAA